MGELVDGHARFLGHAIAHAGELAAAIAYEGHGASVRDRVERAEITRIMFEELDHRARVRTMLDVLDVSPDERRERRMRRIGRLVAAFCHVGGLVRADVRRRPLRAQQRR